MSRVVTSPNVPFEGASAYLNLPSNRMQVPSRLYSRGLQWGLQVRPNEGVVDTELHLDRHMHC